ncbi:MAG: SDR family NAD(P)-dependent oxidoreductase [Pseudomonadota bacterium]
MAGRVGLIIGGNRGIGSALVQELATRWGPGDCIYLTARDHSTAQQVSQQLTETTGQTIRPLCFDLARPDDPSETARRIADEHGGIDLVIQNGAYIARAGHPAVDDARPMIAANSHGTLRVLTAFLPILRERGQIIIVASGLGVLTQLPEQLRPLFDSRRFSPEAINAQADRYVAAVEDGSAAAAGWPDWVNVPSKVAQVAVTRAFARVARDSGCLPPGARINAACPGVTLTDATRPYMGTVFREEDAQTPEVAARELLQMLKPGAMEPAPYGELIQHGKVLNFGDG